VGSILVDVDEKSLMGDTMVIDRVAVVGPEITLEKVRGTDSFQTILKNVKEATGQSGSSKKEPVKTEEKGTGKSLLIKDFVLKDGKVTLSESVLAGKSVTRVPTETAKDGAISNCLSSEPIGKEGVHEPAGFFLVFFHEIKLDHSLENPLHCGDGQTVLIEKFVGENRCVRVDRQGLEKLDLFERKVL